MGADHDPTSIHKNVYIEGIANYRDQMHLRFFQNLRRGPLAPFVFCVVGVPAFFVGITLFGDQSAVQRKAEFERKYKAPISKVDNDNYGKQ